ncbi:bifunctional phosphoribosylaminoimidazolecarboxamide formyltransferase/IMP cyclohydrolase [Peptococcaceae bacterium]|nr:bifunctional phosphoribosylaminoimidazolecarboxamide formyltransferase/IMP cyclohydrolase [Peptococcaceae bacterium]
MIKRALISVWNKEGIAEFAKDLSNMGVEIVSTGGTANYLKEKGIPVTYISDVTGFPEILDGRVKTFHPNIHAGILALRTNEHLEEIKSLNIKPFDLIAVNLYSFKEVISKPDVSFEEAIENIDIGGPAMIRAAAKNFKNVFIVVNPKRYSETIELLKTEENDCNIEKLRLELAYEAFTHVAFYDSIISSYLLEKLKESSNFEEFNEYHVIGAELVKKLRYGENPHQRAAFYKKPNVKGDCIANAKQIHGKELSYNNILDADAAIELTREFYEPTAVIIKHNNPCGCASSEKSLADAYQKAFEGDPVSAFGGIVAFNRVVDADVAEKMKELFLEVIVAPDFDESALEILTQKTNLRLIKIGSMEKTDDLMEVRAVNGGLLLQERNTQLLNGKELWTVTERKVTSQELEDLIFAMKIVKHVKSNAIVVVKDKQLLEVGAGQTSRIEAVEIALKKAGEKARDAVLASDAFFPFRDNVDRAYSAGIRAIIQPGGSVRDRESIEACNEYHIAMVFTGMRHFKH